jgi:alpha-tubulin suppressor-like RCC1 family protein
VYCWGINDCGELGCEEGEKEPVENSKITYEINKISSLHKHTLALTSDGQVLASGDNECDTLGMPDVSYDVKLYEFKPVTLQFKVT